MTNTNRAARVRAAIAVTLKARLREDILAEASRVLEEDGRKLGRDDILFHFDEIHSSELVLDNEYRILVGVFGDEGARNTTDELVEAAIREIANDWYNLYEA